MRELGFGDDYLKLTRRNSKGLPGRLKLAGQLAIAAVAGGETMVFDEIDAGVGAEGLTGNRPASGSSERPS